MTQPPNDRPQPGQWTPPPPPGWSGPAGPQPQPGDSPTPHYQAPQGPYPPPQYQRPQPGPSDTTVFTPQPPPPPKRRAPLIASLVAVVALAGGGALTYVALSDSSENGGATPKEAVQNVVADMENSDLVGLLDDLAPGERDALANPVREDVDKLKELHVLNDDADPSHITGVTFTATNLEYGAKTIAINDHVQIVQLTGGTITLTGDPDKLPISDEIRKLGATGPSTTSRVDLADHPLRIAAQRVGDRWYPSVFYTAADSAAGHRVPGASDAIPVVGSASAEDAVRDEVDALLAGDLRTALAHVSPNELGAVHDYGGMVLSEVPSWTDTGVKIDALETTTSSLSGGGTHVGLKKITLSKDGDAITVEIDGSCASVTAGGHSQKICASDAARLASGFLSFGVTCGGSGWTFSDGSSGGYSEDCTQPKLTKAQRTALTDLFTGFTKLGIATAEVDGKWYVNPVRSVVDVWGTLLGGMKGNDLLELAELGR